MNKSKTVINVNGKEYPCRITMGALIRFSRESGHDVSQMAQGDLAEMMLFVWCCVKSACNAEGIPFDMPFEVFADSLEPDSVAGFYAGMSAPQKKTGSGSL